MQKTENKLTLVLGASSNPSRYSYDAVNSLRSRGFDVFAVGRKEGYIAEVKIHLPSEKPPAPVDTITVYMNAENQKAFYDYMLSLHPRRIIFNPGAENYELEELAREHGIETERACTLVLLATGVY